MKISIQGIGAIKAAKIECNSVTIITGKNGSGKSTFGKAVFSLVSGIQNSIRYYDYNFIRHVQTALKEELRIPYSNFSLAAYIGGANRFTSLLRKAPLKNKSVEAYFEDLIKAAEGIDIASPYMTAKDNSFSNSGEDFQSYLAHRLSSFEAEYYDEAYRLKQLERCVKNEFNEVFIGQVTTNHLKDIESLVSLESEFIRLSFSYSNSRLDFSDGDLRNVYETYFISDGNVLDELDAEKSIASRASSKETITTRPNDHLKDFVRKQPYNPKQELAEAFEIINRVYPYDIYIRNGRTFTSNNGIAISNEASGRKIFALLKYMLLNGAINKQSILVFDEPENHLHPEWQLLFCKLIKLISERTGAKMICITHSPTLLFAMDVLYRERRENLTVYYAQLNDGYSVFEDCSSDISKAHKALSDPFIKLDLLGDQAI